MAPQKKGMNKRNKTKIVNLILAITKCIINTFDNNTHPSLSKNNQFVHKALLCSFIKKKNSLNDCWKLTKGITEILLEIKLS